MECNLNPKICDYSEFWILKGKKYIICHLEVANNTEETTRTTGSNIYKWNGKEFVKVFTLTTQGARDCESFKIKDQTFIAVANDDKDYTENIMSKIYKVIVK